MHRLLKDHRRTQNIDLDILYILANISRIESIEDAAERRRLRVGCLELIIDTLNDKHQRATYGAVAGIIGIPARSVMTGKTREPRHSWIVSRKTHRPTGFHEYELHPSLEDRQDVLTNRHELAEWLRINR